jgi:hypothetical protein
MTPFEKRIFEEILDHDLGGTLAVPGRFFMLFLYLKHYCGGRVFLGVNNQRRRIL